MDYKVPENCGLFAGISPSEQNRLLYCLKAEKTTFDKNEIIWHIGDPVHACGVILTGKVRAEAVNPAGEHTLMAFHGPGSLVGDILMATPGGVSPVYVLAEEASEVLFVPYENIMGGCEKCCAAHVQLRKNLLAEIAQKFWKQRQRVACLSENSLRVRIAMYLMECAGDRVTFSLGETRENLADYLCVNRSALSRELSRMRQEGLLDYYRDSFRILNPEVMRKLLP